MTEFVFDDEQLYEIGSEWLTHEIESSETRKQLVKSKPRPIRQFKRCWKYEWVDCKGILIQ